MVTDFCDLLGQGIPFLLCLRCEAGNLQPKSSNMYKFKCFDNRTKHDKKKVLHDMIMPALSSEFIIASVSKKLCLMATSGVFKRKLVSAKVLAL